MRTLLNSWSVITHSLHESLNRIHQNTAPKFISLILTFLFIVQFPLMAMADHTNEPVIPVSDEDFLYYHHDDHLGSSHVLTEGKDKGYHSGVTYNKGDLLQRFEYEPFGREKYVLNPNLNIDPSYTGQTYDVESGLYYYHARYYDPTLGRFIQPDTLVPDAKNLQAFNRYSYVVNNPFKYTDPSGHGALDWFKKIFGAFIAALVGVVTAFIVASAPGFVAALGAVGSKVVAGTVGGIVGGALGGAITGGHMGALMGLAFGAVGGALGGLGSAGLSEIGVKTFWGQFAVMSGVGAALSGGLGGWEGLVTFGAGALGALAGVGLVRGFGTAPKQQLSSGYGKKGFHFDWAAHEKSFWLADASNMTGQKGVATDAYKTYFLGGRGQMVGPGITGGLYVTTDPSLPWYKSFGTFGIVEGALGVEGSLSVEIGGVKGSLTGTTLNINIGFLFGGSAILSPQTGEILGFSLGVSYGLPSSSASVAHGVFHTSFHDQFIKPFQDLF